MANQEFDITKQFQKSIGRILESMDDAESIAWRDGSINNGFDRAKSAFKYEAWALHDIVKANIDLLKSK
jgi:hypothetical protein